MEVEINRILGLSKLQYVNLVDGQFNVWCEYLSHSYFVPMRVFQKNSKLYNWFLKQWNQTVVIPFLNSNEDYLVAGLIDPETYLKLFISEISEPQSLIRNYPSTVVNTIKERHYNSIKSKA